MFINVIFDNDDFLKRTAEKLFNDSIFAKIMIKLQKKNSKNREKKRKIENEVSIIQIKFENRFVLFEKQIEFRQIVHFKKMSKRVFTIRSRLTRS